MLFQRLAVDVPVVGEVAHLAREAALARQGRDVVAAFTQGRQGGARVTVWVFALMMAGTAGVLWFIGIKDQPGAFWGFFVSFRVLFFATGVGNASTFQMIPVIFWQERRKSLQGMDEAEIRKIAEREAAATIGFSSAIGAYGAFFIPKSYGTAIALTGSVNAALLVFIGYYALCLMVTWYYYTRKNAEIPC